MPLRKPLTPPCDFKFLLCLCLAGLILSQCSQAQGVISTVAGGPAPSENVKATLARLDGLRSLAVDTRGNAYIADGPHIRRVDAATGIIATVAGNGQQTPLTDGIATQVALGSPNYLKFDSKGKLLFVSDGRIMKLDPQTGLVATIACQATSSTEPFNNISSFAPDAAGNFFLADQYTGKIYRVDGQSGVVAIFAGTGGGNSTGKPGGEGGPASQASLGGPYILAVDASGNIFVAEQNWLRRIDGKTGIITTLMPFTANRAYGSGTGDGGPYSKAVLGNASALTTDSAGNLYIADGPRVRKITFSTGIIQTVAGSGQSLYASDGVPALQANLNFLYAIVIDNSGNLWLADQANSRVFEISAFSGLIHTVAGRAPNGDGGPALGASLTNASGIAVSPAGDLYIDASGMRRVDHVTGLISTFAQAQELYGSQFTFDVAGNIYFATKTAIERIDGTSGKITTVAGLYYQGFSGDGGPATSAAMSPSAVAVDSSGNLYIADSFNYRIRRVDAKTGIINTVAGNGGTQAYNGQPGKATQSAIGSPTSIAVQPDGNVYWTNTYQVLKLDPVGNLSLVAGNGGCYYAGDGGAAVLASLCYPQGIAFDGGGNMFIGDGGCSCVRSVAAGTGVIQTVAGTGLAGVSADGIPATRAALNYAGLAFAAGTLYILDESRENNVNPSIRAVYPPVPPSLPQPPKITEIRDAISFSTAFSPGALISIMGNYLSSTPGPASGQIGQDGRVTKTLAGDQVTVQGIAAPLLYTSPAQINAVIPYATVVGTAPVQVATSSGTDTYSDVGLSQTSLAFFSNLVFNPDGSLNSKTNPALKGATLVLYGTGIGQTNPPSVDGAIIQGPSFPQPVNKFTAVLRGSTNLSADIFYLGPLPGFVAGAVQANIHIPDTADPGASSLTILSNGSRLDRRRPSTCCPTRPRSPASALHRRFLKSSARGSP